MQAADIPDKSLAECLEILRRAFDIDDIARRKIDEAILTNYYRQSESGYRLFHSSDGALHLALNHNGRFDPAGYFAQAEFVEKHLNECRATRILEAGSGNGFNTLHLARRHPQRRFVGIDLTKEHVAAVRDAAAAHDSNNLDYVQGNYQSLPFPPGSFDATFGVETFCQASDLPRA